MPKIPYKPEKNRDNDEDYEIVSFEDFCDNSPNAKVDLLTLNDNINYRLCFEANKTKCESEGETSQDVDRQSETSLNEEKGSFRRKSSGYFAPFGRYNGKAVKGSLFGGVTPKPRNDGESSRDNGSRYQRFSAHRNIFQRAWDNLPGLGSGVLGVALIIALCVGVWWAVCGAIGGAWGEEHYKKLWERAHPDNIKKPLTPVAFEKVPAEYRYHDHNNLSTKNKSNGTEATTKKEPLKKNFKDMTPGMLAEVCGTVQMNDRFDCMPSDSSQTACEERGCCWKPASNGSPYCFFPPHTALYRFVNMTETRRGVRAYYTLARRSPYPGDVALAGIDFNYLSDNVLQIKIYDAENKRFEVPVPQIPTNPGPLIHPKYRVQVNTSSVGFKVIRNADNVTILNTVDVGVMILSDKLLQLSTALPTDRVLGLGEHRDTLRRDVAWNTYTIFNSDHVPAPQESLYGSHPFYMAVEDSGNSHGMLLLNSNAMDVVLQPTPALTYRTVGGILNLYLMMGPSPQDVVSQYTGLVGRPFLPPYWALGFHLCKYGYGDLNTTRNVWKTNREAGIPFDVQWNDIDYMVDYNDFTYDMQRFAGLPEFVDTLHKEGMHYILMIDPGVSALEMPGTYPPFDRGLELDIFIKNQTNQPFIGQVWNYSNHTAFPDFTHPNSTGYWLEMISDFHKKVPFDGVWLDMNEPSNFVSGSVYGACEPEELSFRPAWLQVGLSHKTLCMDAGHYGGAHYHLHNLHGLTEVIATNFVLKEVRGKRPFIISRASFPGLGRYAGHWSGDVASTWDDMRMSIPAILSFSLFGIPTMGADICGFNGDTTPELCARWMQLGAFYPFARNHASIGTIPQDPVSLGPEVVATSIAALRLRYALLPHYYTLFWRAHAFGDTVARPLFFENPADKKLFEYEFQFMIGPYLMITPILTPGVQWERAFFPGPQRWFNVRDGAFLASNSEYDVDDHEMVSVKGGAIIPMQEPPTTGPVTTTNSRSRPMQLLVAPDTDHRAYGDLYWDDADSLHTYQEQKYSYVAFSLRDQEINSRITWWGYGVPPISNVTVFDQSAPVRSVSINGVDCRKPHCEFTYTPNTKVLEIYNINLPLDKPFNIKWTYKHTIQRGSFGFKAND